MSIHPFQRRLLSEYIGTAGLLATVIGSGIMAERLAGGNDAVALLGNTLATGAMLVVLITAFGPMSGAHFNPAVTLAFMMRREIEKSHALVYIIVHNSREAAETSWQNFRDDPEWQRVSRESQANGRIVDNIESVFLDPTDYSPMQ